jgi:hypothetical protein
MNIILKLKINLKQIILLSLLCIVVLLLAACEKTSDTSSGEPQYMFVQTAEDIKVDAEAMTLRLVNVNPQTLYFTDRPQRIAGHLKLTEYLEEWTMKAGKDNFTNDPPNATLSVYEDGQPDNTIIVVEINNPVVDGTDLIYNYKIINGTMPASGGASALFIDLIGPGGGVGAGVHGVGVGARGPGAI